MQCGMGSLVDMGTCLLIRISPGDATSPGAAMPSSSSSLCLPVGFDCAATTAPGQDICLLKHWPRLVGGRYKY
jgi:hypothetical protein